MAPHSGRSMEGVPMASCAAAKEMCIRDRSSHDGGVAAEDVEETVILVGTLLGDELAEVAAG